MEINLPIVLPKYQPGVSAVQILPTRKDEISTSRIKTNVMTRPKKSEWSSAKDLILGMLAFSDSIETAFVQDPFPRNNH